LDGAEAAWLSAHDPPFGRALLAVATAIAIPPTCYHSYAARGAAQTAPNIIFLLGILLYAYWQVVAKPRRESRESATTR